MDIISRVFAKDIYCTIVAKLPGLKSQLCNLPALWIETVCLMFLCFLTYDIIFLWWLAALRNTRVFFVCLFFCKSIRAEVGTWK